MSDTPRTEAVNQYLRTRRDYTKTGHEVWMNHGIQIERELNAANSEVERLTKKIEQLYEGAEEQKRTIKELEEVNEFLRAKIHQADNGRRRNEQP